MNVYVSSFHYISKRRTDGKEHQDVASRLSAKFCFKKRRTQDRKENAMRKHPTMKCFE